MNRLLPTLRPWKFRWDYKEESALIRYVEFLCGNPTAHHIFCMRQYTLLGGPPRAILSLKLFRLAYYMRKYKELL